MSKEFIPQASSGERKESFSIHPMPRNGPSVFQMVWPEFRSPEYALLEEKHRRENEDQFLRERKEKAEAIEKEAYEKGFAQGERDGREFEQKKMGPTVHQFQNLVSALQGQKEEIYQRLERELVRLAFSIMRKILRKESPCPEEVIRETLRAAFRAAADREKIRVRLHPKDYQYIGSGGTLVSDAPRDPTVEIIADANITRGGCLLETSFGDVDVTLETQFDNLASLFWEEVKKCGFPTAESS